MPSQSEASSRASLSHGNIGGHGPEGDLEGDRTQEPIASRRTAVNETTSLLRRPFEIVNDPAHTGPCNHGTFSPQVESPAVSIIEQAGTPSANYGDNGGDGSSSFISSILSKVGMDAHRKKKISTTSRLAEEHGITNTTSMYVPWTF